jgi:hypothetical protein
MVFDSVVAIMAIMATGAADTGHCLKLGMPTVARSCPKAALGPSRPCEL